MPRGLKLALSLLAFSALSACEVSYKAQDDAMHYTDRAIGQYHKADEFIKSRFDKNYHPTIDDLPLHLSNFDTFVCDGARQLIANFDREERTVSVSFNGRNKFLSRTDSYYPFTDKIHALFVMEDGSLLLQKDGATIFQHCRPFIADSRKSRPYAGGGGVPSVTPDANYQYTPTMSPVDYNSAQPAFDSRMTK